MLCIGAIPGIITVFFTWRIKVRQQEVACEIELIKVKAAAAATAAAAVKLEVSDSRTERHQQFREVTQAIKENTNMNADALNKAAEAVEKAVEAADVANNTNLKIKELREDFQTSQTAK